ncbi:hypothetical protein EQG41_03190 [Billgrantia azerbaijanica]|nr:hypothetical protein EQG41_03190 [Halomonas azerbaijanica]
MSYNETFSFEDGLQHVQAELASGTPAPEEDPKELTLDAIRMRHSVFQPREFDDVAKSEDHIRTLSDAIKAEPNNRLDPIRIWWSGRHWIVLDGHHRVLAYKRTKEKGFKQYQQDGSLSSQWQVPVSVLRGTLQDALFESTRLNAKDQLPMSKDDKLNRAWKLTILYPEMSKATVAGTCKIGSRTVARMRSQLKKIHDEETEDGLSAALGMTWKEAQMYGKETQNHDDAWQEGLARDWSRRIAKTFGSKLATQPDIAARAIELYSEKLAEELGDLLHRAEDPAGDDF